MSFHRKIKLLKNSFESWQQDKVSNLAAALSYYTAFSLAPMLMIAIGVAGLAFGREYVQTEIINYFKTIIGLEGSQQIEIMLRGSSSPNTSFIATIIGVIILLLGASGFFGQLQDSFNTIWKVAPKPSKKFISTIRDRFLSFTMVVGVGFLLLVSLFLSAFISAMTNYLDSYFSGGYLVSLIFNFLFSLALISFLFALLFKIIPDVSLEWNDVLLSGFLTGLLFEIGKFLLAFYLGHAHFTSSFGAAGALIIILVWVYYSAQILLWGVEFTKVYVLQYKRKLIRPRKEARFITKS